MIIHGKFLHLLVLTWFSKHAALFSIFVPVSLHFISSGWKTVPHGMYVSLCLGEPVIVNGEPAKILCVHTLGLTMTY